MMRAEVRDLSEAYLGRVTHQVADSAVEMCRRMVDILPVLDSDQVGYLGRKKYAAVPASDSSTHALFCNERAIVGSSDVFQPEIRIVLQPRYTPRLV
jgi:hypothetical protein